MFNLIISFYYKNLCKNNNNISNFEVTFLLEFFLSILLANLKKSPLKILRTLRFFGFFIHQKYRKNGPKGLRSVRRFSVFLPPKGKQLKTCSYNNSLLCYESARAQVMYGILCYQHKVGNNIADQF